MASEVDFDFSADVIMAGGDAAERNWALLRRHMVAEWSCDLDATMATMTRNGPFQIMHATGRHIRGWDNVRAFYSERMNTFQGQGFYAHRLVVSEKAIVGTGYFSGTPSGVFFGTQTSGKTLCLPMTVWIYFEDGLIKGEAAYLDGLELQRQIREGSQIDRNTPVY